MHNLILKPLDSSLLFYNDNKKSPWILNKCIKYITFQIKKSSISLNNNVFKAVGKLNVIEFNSLILPKILFILYYYLNVALILVYNLLIHAY